jgi:hypothetical protein
MRLMRVLGFICLLSVFSLAQFSDYFFTATSQNKVVAAEKSDDSLVTVKAEKVGFPNISFKDGTEFKSEQGANQTGNAVKSVSADFDSDGTPDLVIANQNGSLRFLKGNADYLLNQNLSPFIETNLTASLNLSPDFMESGDFNADGHPDILASRKGEKNLYLLAGSGNGQFSATQPIQINGN